MTRRHNLTLISENRSYTTKEIVRLLRVTISTVYGWISAGLIPNDGRRPFLIHGTTLKAFLAKRQKPYQPMQPGEIYCVGCKAAFRPLDDVVSLEPCAATNANILGCCPRCRRVGRRRVRYDRLHVDASGLRIVNEDVAAPIGRDGEPPHTDVYAG